MNKQENHKGNRSFIFDAFLKFSLQKELDVLSKLAEDGKLLDWKSPIVLASSYLEMIGLEMLIQRENVENLKKCFKTIKKSPKPKKDKNDLSWFNLFKVTLLLRNYGLITEEQYKTIKSIREERNDIVHHLRSDVSTEYYNPRLNSEANEKYGKMVNEAKEIIKSLKKSLSQ